MNKHRSSLVFWLILLLFLLGACRQAKTPLAPQATDAPKPVNTVELPDLGEIRVGYVPVGDQAPIFVAYEKGYFEQQGLNVSIQSFRTGAEMIAALGLGQLDGGGGENGTALFNAVEQGLSVRAAMSLMIMKEGYGFMPLVVRKDLIDSGEVKTVADLKGRKIAVNAVRGMTEFLAASGLKKGGLTVDDVELTIVPFPDMAAALSNKSVDAAVIGYPVAYSVLEPGESQEPPIAEVLLPGEQLGDTYPNNAVIYLGKRLLEPENKEAAVRFVMALLMAYRDLQGDWQQDDELVDIILKYTKANAKAVREGIPAYHDPNGRGNPDSIMAAQRYMVERGYTSYDELIPLNEIFDETYLNEALKRLGEYQP